MLFKEVLRLALGLVLAMPTRGEDSPCKIRLIASPSGPPQIELTYLDAKAKPAQKSVAAIVVPRGTPLYHWTEDKRAYEGWGASEGRIPEATMNALHANRRGVGGGVYVSRSVYDSQGYGSHLIVLEAPQDLILLPFESWGFLVTKCPDLWEPKKLMNAGLDGVQDLTETWMALISPQATAKVKGLGDTGTVLSAIHDLTLCELARLDAKMQLVPNDALALYYPTLYKVLSGRPILRTERETMLRDIEESLKINPDPDYIDTGKKRVRSKYLNCGQGYQAKFLTKLKGLVEASVVQGDTEEAESQDAEVKHAL